MSRRSLPRDLARATATTARAVILWPLVALFHMFILPGDDALTDSEEES